MDGRTLRGPYILINLCLETYNLQKYSPRNITQVALHVCVIQYSFLPTILECITVICASVNVIY